MAGVGHQSPGGATSKKTRGRGAAPRGGGGGRADRRDPGPRPAGYPAQRYHLVPHVWVRRSSDRIGHGRPAHLFDQRFAVAAVSGAPRGGVPTAPNHRHETRATDRTSRGDGIRRPPRCTGFAVRRRPGGAGRRRARAVTSVGRCPARLEREPRSARSHAVGRAAAVRLVTARGRLCRAAIVRRAIAANPDRRPAPASAGAEPVLAGILDAFSGVRGGVGGWKPDAFVFALRVVHACSRNPGGTTPGHRTDSYAFSRAGTRNNRSREPVFRTQPAEAMSRGARPCGATLRGGRTP